MKSVWESHPLYMDISSRNSTASYIQALQSCLDLMLYHICTKHEYFNINIYYSWCLWFSEETRYDLVQL